MSGPCDTILSFAEFHRRTDHIAQCGTSTLRHPVGPDAEGFLAWRASLSDEQWADWGAMPDDDWYDYVAKTFGLDVKSKRGAAAVASTGPIQAV